MSLLLVSLTFTEAVQRRSNSELLAAFSRTDYVTPLLPDQLFTLAWRWWWRSQHTCGSCGLGRHPDHVLWNIGSQTRCVSGSWEGAELRPGGLPVSSNHFICLWALSTVSLLSTADVPVSSTELQPPTCTGATSCEVVRTQYLPFWCHGWMALKWLKYIEVLVSAAVSHRGEISYIQ